MAKYITYTTTFGGIKVGIIFSETQNHADVVSGLGITREDIIGAGFCEINNSNITTYGKSTSLRVSCSKDDDTILNTMFRT